MAKPTMTLEVKIDGVKEVEVCLLMAEYFSKKDELKKLGDYRNYFMMENQCKKGNCLRNDEGEKITKPDIAALCNCCKELHTIYKERQRLRLKMRNAMDRVKRRLAHIILKPISAE